MPNQTMVYSCSGAEQEYTMVWFGIFLYPPILSLKIRFCEQSVFAKSPLLNSHLIKHLVEKLLEYIIIWHLTHVRGVIGVTLEQGGSGNLPIVLQQEFHQELPGKLTNVYLSEAYYIVYLIMIMLDPGLVKATQCSSRHHLVDIVSTFL